MIMDSRLVITTPAGDLSLLTAEERRAALRFLLV